jgi:MinD-like ATPase involved in chromosome partitioning or flagellar assembly
MQYGPLGGAVRVVIASDAPQAVAELDKLAGYADQVSLVGFIRYPDELDENLEALLPDLVLLYTGFGGLDTVSLAADLSSRSAQLRVMVVVDPSDDLFIAHLEDAGAATVPADANPAALVAAIRGAVAESPPPTFSEFSSPAWPSLDVSPLSPEEPYGEPIGPATPHTVPTPEPPGDELSSPAWPGLDVSLPSPEEPYGEPFGTPTPDTVPTSEPPGDELSSPAWPGMDVSPPSPEEPYGEPFGTPTPDTVPTPEPPGDELSSPAWPGMDVSPPSPEEPYGEPFGTPTPDTVPTHEPPDDELSPPAAVTEPTAWEERSSEELALPAQVPVFQLDTTAFEAAPDTGPPSGEEWPGVPAVPTITLPVSTEPEPEPIQPVRPRPARRRARGHADLVVVFSGKGGIGTSLIATNLAVALAAQDERVAIVDLDLQFGDVAVMLHAESHPTAIDALAQQGEQVDSEFIEEVMATGPEGVRALLAPASPEFADLVNTASLRAILRELAKSYDYVVVDTPSHLEERNLEAIEMADQMIIVTNFNFAAIKDTKVTLKLLQSLGVDRDKICVVLNQTRAKVSFQRSEVEESLRFRVLTVLPFEPRVDDCIDNGQLIVTAEPKSEFSKQFRVLVDHIAGSDEGDETRDAEHPRARVNRRRFSLGRS